MSIEHILSSFDVDCCCIGYDGKKIWCTPRSHFAILYKKNILNLNKYSSSYEYRLYKYSLRGFALHIPNLRMSEINENIFLTPINKLKGLSKLLALDKLGSTSKYKFFIYRTHYIADVGFIFSNI